MGLDARKLVLGGGGGGGGSGGVAKNKGTDQPTHSCSLISKFVIHLLESIISRLATSEISIFYLVSVAEQAGLNITSSDTPTASFVV